MRVRTAEEVSFVLPDLTTFDTRNIFHRDARSSGGGKRL